MNACAINVLGSVFFQLNFHSSNESLRLSSYLVVVAVVCVEFAYVCDRPIVCVFSATPYLNVRGNKNFTAALCALCFEVRALLYNCFMVLSVFFVVAMGCAFFA